LQKIAAKTLFHEKVFMNKIAQRRSLLNQLREKVNMPGAYLEGFFKPELDRVMNALKDLDDRVRSVLTGKKIGNGEAPEDGVSVKDLLKSARTNFNRREYMSGVVDLGQFHKKMFDVTRDIDKFFVDVNKIHHKFLFEGLKDTGYDNHLKQMREHMDNLGKKAELNSVYFIKEAGVMDFFYNIGTKRGRSLAAWEKKYPKQTKDLREGGERLIGEAEKLLENTIGYLKQMGTARATRRPDEYMDIANKIKGDYQKFDGGDKGFRSYYSNAVVPWLKIKDEIEASQAKSEPKLEGEQSQGGPAPGQVELGTPEVSQTSPSMPAAQPTVQDSQEKQAPNTDRGNNLPIDLVHNKAPITPAPISAPQETIIPKTETTVPTAPDTEKKLPVMMSHQKFYASLEKMSEENPAFLAKYISKYASSIQEKDMNTAIELFSIVRKIKG